MLYDPKWENNKLPDTKTALLKAAELIRYNGLAKGTRRDAKGGYCIHGAVSMAIYNDPGHDDYDMEIHGTRVVMSHIVNYMDSVGIDRLTSHSINAANWNNMPERTADEVIAVLEGAANAI